MNNYNIHFTATCKKCNSTNTFVRLLIRQDNDDEIENPTINQLLDYVDRGEITVCPMCGVQGQFNISKIQLEDEEEVSINDNLMPYSIYVLKSDKINGEIRCWNEPGYFSVAQVSVAFDSINKYLNDELWHEPLEGEDNGFFEIKVEFYKDPIKTKVYLNNQGYSQEELIMVVNGFYDKIPNDKK